MIAEFTTGDSGPDLEGTINASLVNATSIQAHIRWADETVASLDADAVDASAGTWTALWAAAGTDITVEGDAEVELEVVFSNGKRQTFGPATFHVRKGFA